MWVHRPLKYCGIRTCCICAVIDIQFPRQIEHTWHVTRDSFSALFLEQLMPHHTPHHVSVLVLLQTFRHWHLESFLNFPLHFLLPVEIDLFLSDTDNETVGEWNSLWLLVSHDRPWSIFIPSSLYPVIGCAVSRTLQFTSSDLMKFFHSQHCIDSSCPTNKLLVLLLLLLLLIHH